MENWIAEVVGKMHINKVTQIDVARELDVTNDYVSMILLGKKTPKNAKERITNAVEKIIAERNTMIPKT